jgi:hypothetical protein
MKCEKCGRDIQRAPFVLCKSCEDVEVDKLLLDRAKRFNGLKVGDRVIYSGYKGTVTRLCEWSQGLIECRVPGGVTCIDASEVKKVEASSNA